MLRTRVPCWLPMIAVAVLACASAPTQTPLETLQRSAALYQAADVFQIEGDIEADLRAGEVRRSTTASFRVAVGGPGKLHDELDHSQAGVTRVSDGTRAWIYMTSLNQYVVKDEAASTDFSKGAGEGMVNTLVKALRTMADKVDSIAVLPDETLRFDGAERRCAVLEVRYQPEGGTGMPGAARTFWIDRERSWVLQTRVTVKGRGANGVATEQSETFRYTRVSLGHADPALFAFQPPTGAKQVTQFEAPGEVGLAGQMASEFTLADLAGKRHSLKAQRGKVVMLDFWASWCGPCRIQMPLVEKLSQEYKGKGLVVYAVNQGESAEIARRYLAKNSYSTTALLDQKKEVGRQYQVSGIPTLVIIDRDGKIAAHYVGVRNESVVREGLKKAGL